MKKTSPATKKQSIVQIHVVIAYTEIYINIIMYMYMYMHLHSMNQRIMLSVVMRTIH